jgi:vanillate O-demethylase monooxygenase subunit
MSRTSASIRRRGTTYPVNTWYVIATKDEVSRQPLARRALETPVVLYRTQDGQAVALEDRDAHRPYPLSLGRVDGDTIVSGYSGFAYAPDGACVHVPTQPHVPIGARVRAFPVVEQDGLVWVWLGVAPLASRRNPPRTPWLAGDGWTTLGDQWDTQANLLLLHENFADITHVPVVDPFIAPPVLAGEPPALEVEVSETSVSFSRDYPPARLTGWHADALGLSSDTEHAQREEVRSSPWPLGGCLARLRGRRIPRTPVHPRGHPGVGAPDPARVAGQSQLRVRARGVRTAAADLRRVLPAGPADPGDDAAGHRQRRPP